MNSLLKTMALCLSVATPMAAETLKVSLAAGLPPAVIDAEHGMIPDLLKEMNALPGGVHYETAGAFPFRRSLDNVVSGAADFHMPILKNPNIPEESLPFAYSSGTLFRTAFVLYTNKAAGKEIQDHIADFKVYVLTAHTPFFNGVKGEMEVLAALKRVNDNQIDGYIGPMPVCDSVLRESGLTNIRRQLLTVFETKAAIPKGEKGAQTDKALGVTLDTLRQNGTLEKLFPESVYSKFNES